MHYAKMAAAGYKGGLITAPDVGDFCCAKFTQDDTWYRVLVTGVKQSATGNDVTLQQGPLKNKNLARERSLHFCASVSPRAEKYEALSNVSPQGVYIDNMAIGIISARPPENFSRLVSNLPARRNAHPAALINEVLLARY